MARDKAKDRCMSKACGIEEGISIASGVLILFHFRFEAQEARCLGQGEGGYTTLRSWGLGRSFFVGTHSRTDFLLCFR